MSIVFVDDKTQIGVIGDNVRVDKISFNLEGTTRSGPRISVCPLCKENYILKDDMGHA